MGIGTGNGCLRICAYVQSCTSQSVSVSMFHYFNLCLYLPVSVSIYVCVNLSLFTAPHDTGWTYSTGTNHRNCTPSSFPFSPPLLPSPPPDTMPSEPKCSHPSSAIATGSPRSFGRCLRCRLLVYQMQRTISGSGLCGFKGGGGAGGGGGGGGGAGAAMTNFFRTPTPTLATSNVTATHRDFRRKSQQSLYGHLLLRASCACARARCCCC